MNQTTIADIEDLGKGAAINKLTAEVKKAFEPSEGEGQHGTWKCQGVILRDGDDEIRATFWDRFNMDFRNLEGETVTLTSGTDKKGKFSGVTVDEYKGKKQLKVSVVTDINTSGGEPITENDVKEVFNATETPDGSDQESGLPASLMGSVGRGASAPSSRFVSEETKRESIERQVALKSATELSAAAGVLDIKDILVMAEKMYQFLHGDS